MIGYRYRRFIGTDMIEKVKDEPKHAKGRWMRWLMKNF